MLTLATGHEPITNRQLVQYAALVLLGVLVVHGYTALLAESRITVLTMVLLLVVAVYALVFTARNRTSLRIRAYGGLGGPPHHLRTRRRLLLGARSPTPARRSAGVSERRMVRTVAVDERAVGHRARGARMGRATHPGV